MMSLPNILTLSRIVTLPLLAFLLWWPDWEWGYLMDLDAANIRVAEYLAHIPDMKLMQAQLHRAVALARERAASGQLPHLPDTNTEAEGAAE